MIVKPGYNPLILFGLAICLAGFGGIRDARAEALVVLEYPGFSGGNSSSNEFVRNPNHKARHKIEKDETLSEILHRYYGDSGLNMKFIELAVVSINRSAFVRGNPNFMFAGKNLHLPSLTEIDQLLRGQNGSGGAVSTGDNRDEIFFIGG